MAEALSATDWHTGGYRHRVLCGACALDVKG